MLIVLLVILVSSSSCSARYSGPVDSVTLGTPLLETAIPILIAADQGMFARNGLNVTMKSYESGLAATNALLAGEVDIAAPLSEYVLVGKVLEGEAISAIASSGRADFAFFVARKDRGITSVSDLRGKSVSVLGGANLEFYLGRSLELHGLSADDVLIVRSASRGESVEAFTQGDVDAVVSVEPYVSTMRGEFGENAAVWSAQSSQPAFAMMACRDAWIATHPEQIRRFLTAIEQAERFIIQHPDEAKAIAKQKLNLTDAQVASIWSRNQFTLSLDFALIAAMEDEARWMISNNLTDRQQVPDFVDYVYLDGLQAVKPQAVTIIR